MKWAEQGQYLQQNPSEDFKLKRQPRPLPGMIDTLKLSIRFWIKPAPEKPVEQLWLGTGRCLSCYIRVVYV